MDESLTCAYCGVTGRVDVRLHSGTLECGRCWTYRKLDRPAALHWSKVAAEFLSNVDMYDVETYLPSCGVEGEDVTTSILSARKIEVRSRYLVEHGPQHTWSDEVEAHYENEMRRTRR